MENIGSCTRSRTADCKDGGAGGNRISRTTQLMRGVDYIVRKAEELKKPVTINISFGNTYGSHDGTSLWKDI